MEELEKGLKELRALASSWGGGNSVNQPDLHFHPGTPRDWTTNQRVHMEGPMAPAAYVAEDGLVGYQWEERPLGLRFFCCPSVGECRKM